MITRLYVNNYKSLINFELELNRQNLFLGDNGMGKTTVLEVIHNLKCFICGSIRSTDVFLPSTLNRWLDLNLQTFELDMVKENREYSYHLEIEYDLIGGHNRIKEEWLKCENQFLIHAQGNTVFLYNDSYENKLKMLIDWTFSAVGLMQERYENTKLIEFRNSLDKVIFCSPVPVLMRDRTNGECKVPSVHFENIASVYRAMVQEYTDSTLELFEAMRHSFPNFSRLMVQGSSEPDGEKVIKLEYRKPDGKYELRFSELSDGEKMLVALYILTYCYLKNGYSIFLDEADNYIALSEIQTMLSSLEDLCAEESQYIMISHNPQTIDYFDPKDAIWFSRGDDLVVRTKNKPDWDEGCYTASEILARGLNGAE